MTTTRAAAISTYSRVEHIAEVITGVLSPVPNGTAGFVVDDAITHFTSELVT